MCEGTLLPHWVHLFKCDACQRLAALRVRSRILDVLRFGTPIGGQHRSTSMVKRQMAARIHCKGCKAKREKLLF